MRLIVGLGNPGAEHENTRHNIGFAAVEKAASILFAEAFKPKKKCGASIIEANYKGEKIILAEPQTFMNNSGQAVQELLNWYKIKKENLIVICDDLDLEEGMLRIRGAGSSGGHRGILSIIDHLGTSDFKRIRVGIGRPDIPDAANYVLQKLPVEKQRFFADACAKAAQAALDIISTGLPAAMNKYNG